MTARQASVRVVTSMKPVAERRVFISYAHEDQALAQRISDALAQSEIPNTKQSWEISPGQDLTSQLRESVRASDVVVVVLSQATERSRWIDREFDSTLSDDLDRRGVDLIPVLAASADLPTVLRDRAIVDLTRDFAAGLQQLVAQIEAMSQVDFSTMTPSAFEGLVADLLQALGFRLDKPWRWADTGIDLRATYERDDPFGRPETEVWLVEMKLYAHRRVSVDAIRQLAGAVAVASGPTRGLLVTNGQLTSVAREYVGTLEQTPNVRLRLIDGIELKRLLRQFPGVAARHFGATATSKPRRHDDP
jgi:hypothetical protein